MHKLILGVFCMVIIVISPITHAEKYELRINLMNCMPDGVINSWREKWNPREFWVSQHVVLETDLERDWKYQESLDRCREQKNPIEKQKCFTYYESYHQAAIRCKEVARKLCRANGAFC